MTPAERGRHELRDIRRKARALFWTVGFFSLFVNVLTLTGPMFMLQVYDRVLGSRSEETLLALVGPDGVPVPDHGRDRLCPHPDHGAGSGRGSRPTWTGGCSRR